MWKIERKLSNDIIMRFNEMSNFNVNFIKIKLILILDNSFQ